MTIRSLDLELQSKWTVYAAIGGMFAMMGFFVYYASLDNPFLEQAEVELQSIEVLDVDTIGNSAELEIIFLVKNPSEKTFTVPSLTYEIFANGESLGEGKYSTEDIPMPGRVPFFGGEENILKSIFQITLDTVNPEIYQMIVNGEDVNFTATGVITVETAWALIDKEFTI